MKIYFCSHCLSEGCLITGTISSKIQCNVHSYYDNIHSKVENIKIIKCINCNSKEIIEVEVEDEVVRITLFVNGNVKKSVSINKNVRISGNGENIVASIIKELYTEIVNFLNIDEVIKNRIRIETLIENIKSLNHENKKFIMLLIKKHFPKVYKEILRW